MPVKGPKITLMCAECMDDFQVVPYRARTAIYCSWACGQKGKARRSAIINGPKWRGGGEGKSYIKFEGRHMHRVVAEQKLGRPLAPGEVVHHIDGNKRNNAPENLEVTFQSDHIKLHLPMMRQRQRELAGKL